MNRIEWDWIEVWGLTAQEITYSCSELKHCTPGDFLEETWGNSHSPDLEDWKWGFSDTRHIDDFLILNISELIGNLFLISVLFLIFWLSRRLFSEGHGGSWHPVPSHLTSSICPQGALSWSQLPSFPDISHPSSNMQDLCGDLAAGKFKVCSRCVTVCATVTQPNKVRWFVQQQDKSGCSWKR